MEGKTVEKLSLCSFLLLMSQDSASLDSVITSVENTLRREMEIGGRVNANLTAQDWERAEKKKGASAEQS